MVSQSSRVIEIHKAKIKPEGNWFKKMFGPRVPGFKIALGQNIGSVGTRSSLHWIVVPQDYIKEATKQEVSQAEKQVDRKIKDIEQKIKAINNKVKQADKDHKEEMKKHAEPHLKAHNAKINEYKHKKEDIKEHYYKFMVGKTIDFARS